MAKLPSVAGLDAVKALKQFGFVVDRIAGSHHIMKREGHAYALSIPVHAGKPVKPGTLRSLIRSAGITIQEFINAL